MLTLYLVSVWLHILAATVWIGGMAFLVLVVVPLIRNPESRPWAATFIMRSGLKFRTVGWVCFGLLIATGAFNMWFRGLRWGAFFTGEYRDNPIAVALFYKLLLVGAVLVISAVHDFWLGPRAAQIWEQHPDSAEATRFRKLASRMGRANALLALAIVFLAVCVVRGGLPG